MKGAPGKGAEGYVEIRADDPNPEVPEEHVTRRRRLETPTVPSENVEPDGDAAMTGERLAAETTPTAGDEIDRAIRELEAAEVPPDPMEAAAEESRRRADRLDEHPTTLGQPAQLHPELPEDDDDEPPPLKAESDDEDPMERVEKRDRAPTGIWETEEPRGKRAKDVIGPDDREAWAAFEAVLEYLQARENKEKTEERRPSYRMRYRRQRRGRKAHMALYTSKAKMRTAAEIRRDREVKWNSLTPADMELFRDAIDSEWKTWLEMKAVKAIDGRRARGVQKSRILPSRFVLTDKNKHAKGAGLKAKARLVCGGQHDPDIQSLRTDAPTVDLMGVQTLLTWAASRRWRIQSGDVTCAFLNGHVDKRSIYLRPPKLGLPGVPEDAHLEVQKGVFGLANAPRLWWRRFREILEGLGFEEMKLLPCLFASRGEDGEILGMLGVHVGGIILCGDLKSEFAKKYHSCENS